MDNSTHALVDMANRQTMLNSLVKADDARMAVAVLAAIILPGLWPEIPEGVKLAPDEIMRRRVHMAVDAANMLFDEVQRRFIQK